MLNDKQFNSRRFSNTYENNEVEKVRVEKILKLIGHKKHVLDLGCGDGVIMQKIKDLGNTVEGMEISTAAIAKAKKGFKVYDVSLNSKNWPSKIKKKYDVIFCGEVIEHIIDTDNFLQNIRRVLKNSGYLVITTPNLASLGRRILLLIGKNPFIETSWSETIKNKKNAGHVRYFVKQTLIDLLQKHSFKILDYMSGVINFDQDGKIHSAFLANIFPTFGNTIIIKAKMNPLVEWNS